MQLLVLGGVLALLLGAWDEVGLRAAGCVGQVADGDAAAPAGPVARPEQPATAPGAFEVRVERRPAATGR